MKNDSIILKLGNLPNEKIKDLELSYRDIGKRCHKISKKYSYELKTSNMSASEVNNHQKKLRRDLSNWVNDPNNLVNCNGKYIGDNIGARITVCRSDGRVTHDVETFCRDVKNKNNRMLGTNNNYIFIKNEHFQLNKENNEYIYSTLDVNTIKNSGIKYKNIHAYKVKSSSLPSSDPNSNIIKYSPNDTTSDNSVTVVSGEIMDLHSTRKEIIQATSGKYGYDSRISSTTRRSHYVCEKIEGEERQTYYFRLSYFQFPPATILDVAVSAGSFMTLVAALKSVALDKVFQPSLFTQKDSFLTVFAPTDDAFAAFYKLIGGVTINPEQLSNVLKYHVVPGKIMAADVVKQTSLKTLTGQNLAIRVKNGKVYVNDALVTSTDITASNGVIHVINAVLSPPPS